MDTREFSQTDSKLRYHAYLLSRLKDNFTSISASLTSTLQAMADSNGNGFQLHPPRQRRSRVPEKPDKSVNLWSVLKNCVGKDNVKLPCPVKTRGTMYV